MNKNFTLQLEQFESYSLALMHFIEKMPESVFNVPEFTPGTDLVNTIVYKIKDLDNELKNDKKFDIN